jgi:hypothetical protein
MVMKNQQTIPNQKEQTLVVVIISGLNVSGSSRTNKSEDF